MKLTNTQKDNTHPCYHPAVPHHPDSPFTCHRCQGLLVRAFCIDLYDSSGENGFWALRCLQCGELLDPQILHNRTANPRSVLTGRSRQQFPLTLR
jgi:hypothetical protein